MEQRIQECYTGKASTEYILPFFWQHGEELSVLKEEIDAIQKSGVNEFCVESRTHEDFCQAKWWEDFGFILEEARKRGMRVWLLDDKRFPTGYANGYIETHPELRAVRLRMDFRDFAGPQEGTALLPVSLNEEERFVSVVAYRRTKSGDLLTGEGIELLSKQENGLIWWDIPEGLWRVCYVIRTHKTVARGAKQIYIDMMSEESCKAMLHAVYEPHYEHFKEYFGNTFVGFFSDEPGFANDDGHYDSTLGRENMPIPWNDALPGVLAEKTGLSEKKVLALLPALWHEVEGFTPLVREAYMEAATQSYSKNFCQMLGDWCRAHDVMYIGHVIEDQNSHQRLGYSAGHFFRSLDGQDMAGCDIVLHQIIPGHTELEHSVPLAGKRAEPAFFHYTLFKLASSHAHIQPLKKGRAMCEIYGAFGWAEGIPEMKHLTDLALVSGINYFVPHAFTPKYPDYDCPPHFYARGMNTQYPLFGELMGYMQRMAHVLSGGVHQAHVAVYYNAEAEWAGGKRMLQHEVCKVLTRNQIDFDLIPQDVLCTDASVITQKKRVNDEGVNEERTNEERTKGWDKKGLLAVNGETYGALVVPYSQYLPEKVLKTFARFAADGLQVWFVDGYPDASTEQYAFAGACDAGREVVSEECSEFRKNVAEDYSEESGNTTQKDASQQKDTVMHWAMREIPAHCNVAAFSELAERLKTLGLQGIHTSQECPLLRYIHIKRGEKDVFMLWNEDIFNEIDTEITFPEKGSAVFYDAWNNRLFTAAQNGNQVRVRLAPSQAIVLYFGEEEAAYPEYDYRDGEMQVLKLNWKAGLRQAKEQEFTEYPLSGLHNLARELADFSGVIRYEAVWNTDAPEDYRVLELGGVGETAQLWVNEEYCGAVVAKPYRFAIGGKLKCGENHLRIEVMSNLAYRERDGLSTYLPLPPTGLLGDILVGQ